MSVSKTLKDRLSSFVALLAAIIGGGAGIQVMIGNQAPQVIVVPANPTPSSPAVSKCASAPVEQNTICGSRKRS